jgi:hypothetical protein
MRWRTLGELDAFGAEATLPATKGFGSSVRFTLRLSTDSQRAVTLMGIPESLNNAAGAFVLIVLLVAAAGALRLALKSKATPAHPAWRHGNPGGGGGSYPRHPPWEAAASPAPSLAAREQLRRAVAREIARRPGRSAAPGRWRCPLAFVFAAAASAAALPAVVSLRAQLQQIAQIASEAAGQVGRRAPAGH